MLILFIHYYDSSGPRSDLRTHLGLGTLKLNVFPVIKVTEFGIKVREILGEIYLSNLSLSHKST